ncbi:protein TonB [bacterium A37T11]|nr:protein TonB [bacterium A37T11]
MFHSKNDIFGHEWLDLVFAGRNQHYGAYMLRKEASTTINKALLLGIGLLILTVLLPAIARYFKRPELTDPVDKDFTTIVDLLPPPAVDPATPPPPAVAPPPPSRDIVRMPPFEIVPENQVSEEPPTVDILKKADPGPETIDGNIDADIRIDAPLGKGDKDSQITERGSHVTTSFEAVEVKPEFPGGMAKFGEYIGQNFNYPSQAVDQGIRGKVLMQFVVERDGSLTDIKILRDLGYGTGLEAIRILKASPKWKPGIQNGRPVRVTYTLPISLDVSLK